MNGEDGAFDAAAFDAAALRELAYFTLAGAQIFASDSTFLPSASPRDGHRTEPPAWGFLVAAVAWVATFAYLGLSIA